MARVEKLVCCFINDFENLYTMSRSIVPDCVFTNWLTSIVRNSPHLHGKWFASDDLLDYFCVSNSVNPKISSKFFKRKMNKICRFTNYLYKNDVYSNSDRKYFTYYLVTNKAIDSDRDVADVFTCYSDISQSKSHQPKTSVDNIASNYATTSSDRKLTTSTPSELLTDIPLNSKWYSPEAQKYFLPKTFCRESKNCNDEVSDQKQKIIEHLRKQMVLFRDAWLIQDAWRKLIDDEDNDNVYTNKDIFNVRRKAKYLFRSLDEIVRNYETSTVTQSVSEAIKKIDEIESSCEIDDYENNVSCKTIMKWYRTFNNRGNFPNVIKIKSNSRLPPLIDANPDLKEAVVNFCNENLSTLSAELLHNYITETCIPALLKTRRNETNNPTMTIDELLRENQLKSLHPRTVNNWMAQLGFTYQPRKKTY